MKAITVARIAQFFPPRSFNCVPELTHGDNNDDDGQGD
jgi:hypothetical protein